jgi:N-acetylglucosaminyl-diphospho-decaprenol L-rhamnosyltransferase
MTSKDPDFSVIVVAYNSGGVLSRCMDALARQTFGNFEVLLVDNGSDDGPIEKPDLLGDRTRVLRPGKNLGFAAGNNLAARSAAAKWLVLLNPDAFPEADWLSRIDDAIRRYPQVSFFGSTQLRASDPKTLDGAGDHYHPLGLAWRGGEGGPAEAIDIDAEVFGPCGAAAVYRRDVFEVAGGFAESFFCYYEDVDLAFRLRIAGEICVQLAGAKVEHMGSTTTGAGSDFIRYHVTRNRIWTFMRAMPGPLLFILLPGLVATLMARMLIAPFTGDLGTRARAIVDALAGMPRVLEERREIQAHRKVNVLGVARMMTWSMGKLLLRARDPRGVPVAMDGKGHDGAS